MKPFQFSTFSFYLLVFNFYLFPASPNHVNPDQYKRNTQPLPHIQGHGVFKFFLVLFNKLDHKTSGKDQYQKHSKKKSLTIFSFRLPIQMH